MHLHSTFFLLEKTTILSHLRGGGYFSSSSVNITSPFTTKWRAYESFSRRSMASLAAGLFAFFATAISASVYMPIKSSSAAETVTPLFTVDGTPSISVSASAVDFGRISKVYGDRVVRTASNTVTVNAPLYGYELYISSSNSNNLVRYGTAGSSGTEIIPAAPTISTTNPTALNDDTWGFAVKKRNTTVNSGSEDVPTTANFDISYPTGDDSNPDSRFSAVPTQDNQLLIAERNSTATNVLTDVYYGVSIKDASIGIYQGTITYTAIGKEPTTHTAMLKLVPGIAKITIGDTECNSTNATNSTDASDPEGTKQCEVTLAYGYSYSLAATPEENHTFNSWTLSNTNGAFSDSNMTTTAFTAGQGDTTIIPSATLTTYTQTTEVRYENIDGSWGSYATIDTQNISYGNSYSWSTSQISGFDSAAYQAANVTSYTVTGAKTNQVSIYRNVYTCSKQYRLEDQNGNWGSYNSVTGESLRYGNTCNYSQSYTDYQTKSTSDTVNGNITLSLSLLRNTYALTINRNTSYISSVSGAGTYRWGQSVNISATAASGGKFSSWSLSSGTAGTFGNTSSASTTFTMGKGAATIYANGTSSGSSGGGSSCTSVSGYVQSFTGTASYCSTSGTLTDRRDDQKYTVRKINGKWWMTRNLAIGCNGSGTSYGSSVSSKSLTSTYSNVSSSWSTPMALLSTPANSDSPGGFTTAAMQCSSTYGAWYNYKAATAGTISGSSNTTNATYDICPKRWRLFTSSESDGLISAIGSSPSNFKPVAGGHYVGGATMSNKYGLWWSSTSYSGTYRIRLTYTPSKTLESGAYDRYNGSFVRCIHT